ncbi:hypothetical protein [Bacillus sp. UNC438CL73TsuS30]|uniref:hypothetical protein n=1 Tax=Bacillus sp. UNC438CL73TsuS30 TaxID=1340434 RepID=UPI0005564EC9|nr:hypothetical protein [Bacillus sp. UNC438CL73TsuS30]
MDEKVKSAQFIQDLKAASNNNSSMAQNLDEMKKLGKEMKEQKTGSELREENLSPDPLQD